VPAIEHVVQTAYAKYVDRIGKPPGPMLDDYTTRVAEGSVRVLEDARGLAGILVVLPQAGYLLLENIAVAPERQGEGIGRRLLAAAESEALQRGFDELRLYPTFSGFPARLDVIFRPCGLSGNKIRSQPPR